MAKLGADGPLFKENQLRRQSAGAQKNREVGRFLDRKAAGYDAGPTRNVALDRRRADHLVVKHDGKRRSDILGGIIAKLACAGRIEPEVHRRAAVLVKARLCVHKLLAGDDRRLFKHIVGARIIKRRKNLAGCCDDHIRVAGAAHHRLERQLRGRADPALQLLSRFRARNLNEDAIRALTLDRRLAGARGVDAAADDLERLLQRPLVGRGLFGLAERDRQHRPLGRYDDVGRPSPRNRRNGPCKPAHQFKRLRGALGFGNANLQNIRLALFPRDKSHILPLGRKNIAHIGPHRFHRRGIDIRDLHFGQKMRPAPKIETQIDKARRQERGPERGIRLKRLVGKPVVDRGDGIVVTLHPVIEKVGHGQRQPDHAGQNNKNLPER